MPREQAPDIAVRVGRRIRELRRARGLTQAQLGQLVHLTWQQVQRYERGTATLSLLRLVAFADALGMPVSKLVSAGAHTADVSPATYFRNQVLTEEDVQQVLEYAEFLRRQRRRKPERRLPRSR
jgi:transcriptional regulator with XRE-family HTH domain